MWAQIENGEVTRIIRGGLNVKIGDELIGNLALLDTERRKELGVYVVIEPDPHDQRYYGASCIKNRIDHEKALVVQTNVLQPQPFERIVQFRLEELDELMVRKLNEEFIIELGVNIKQPIRKPAHYRDGQLRTSFKIHVKVDSALMTRLTLIEDGVENTMSPPYVQNVDGEWWLLSEYDFRDLRGYVAGHIEDIYKATAEATHLIKNWGEEDLEGLIEVDIEEMFEARLGETYLHHDD